MGRGAMRIGKVAKVRWSEVHKTKKSGGIRIASLVKKYLGLLCKWLWRYGKDEGALWKRLLCEKYEWVGGDGCYIGYHHALKRKKCQTFGKTLCVYQRLRV